MRSSSTTGGGGGSETATTKKKFGKNLNKLVKPAAPPIVDRSSGSSRNGLLLLSTKKSHSSLSSSATGGAHGSGGAGGGGGGGGGAGLLSTKSTTTASTAAAAGATADHHNLPAYDSKAASTHDVLLSAVVGAVQAEAHLPPDAWGVAAAAAAAASNQQQEQTNDGSDDKHHESEAETAATTDQDEGHDPYSNKNNNNSPVERFDDSYEYHHHQLQQQERSAEVTIQTSNWDEYGGRGDVSSGRHNSHRTGLDVGGGGTSGNGRGNVNNDNQGVIMSRLARERSERRRSEEDARMNEQKERAAQRLRELDEKKASSSASSSQKQLPEEPPRTPPRRGWDATRSGSRELWEPEQVEADNSRRNKKDGPSPPHSPPQQGQSSSSKDYNGPVIHLSSYEDRDRGEQRSAGAAPRMLYDPKSGSMVAVKSRDETSSSNRKKAKKSRKDRDVNNIGGGHHKKSDASTGIGPRDSSPDNNNSGKNSRKPANKRGGEEPKNGIKGGGGKKSANPARRLPRTCGVMYMRDDKGNCYCADDCDGDLGYGAHSVPGGRAKNPDAYSEYVKQHQHVYNNGKEENLFGEQYGVDDPNYSNDGDVALHTGFNPAAEEEHPEPVEYVKADDKLELVTGVDDSPTLKPTAKIFAPSHAALAAAAAAKSSTNTDKSVDTCEENEDDDREEEEEEESDDDEGPLGLGFDPTQGMDFVMESPSGEEPEDAIADSVAISALALEPPAVFSPIADNGPRHIFAFGSSGTWGVAQPSAETGSDWKLPGVSETSGGGLFDGGGIFRGGGSIDETKDSTSFLNIPSSTSWGAPGNLGLPTNGEDPTTTTGD